MTPHISEEFSTRLIDWSPVAATKHASNQKSHRINVFGAAWGMSKADPWRNRGMSSYTCRGLRVELRRLRNGLAVVPVIW